MTMPAQAHPEVRRQMTDLMTQSPGFRALSLAQQAEVLENSVAVADAMVADRLKQAVDPYSVEGLKFGDPPGPVGGAQVGGAKTGPGAGFTGGATTREQQKITKGEFGVGIKTGVNQAGELLKQVNFPAFVAELVQGVFQAVVDASVQQMRAYAEMVQSVTMSLNQFRDANVTENQGRDHLVSKYPKLMQINLVEGQPRVGLRPGADTGSMPNFREELGLSEDVSSLDDDLIETKLVLGARNDLARSRQSLLATMMLMGINRIVVTDGKINAKLNFAFKTQDTQVTNAQTYDYDNLGTTTTYQQEHESSGETGKDFSANRGWGSSSQSGESKRWTKGASQYASTPAIYLTSATDTTTSAEATTDIKLAGEVSLAFKSETFDINKIATAGDVFKLEQAKSAGRAAPPAGTPAAGPPTGAPATTTRAGQ